MAVDARVAALQNIPLFAGLTPDQLIPLATTTLRQHCPRGQILFNRGDPGDRAYIIIDGMVDLVIESSDGRELILSRLGAGEHFGEMTLVDDMLRSATARVAAPSELVVVLRGTFLQALRSHSEMSIQIIRALVQRLRVADEKIEAFAYLDAAGRIARALLTLLSVDGHKITASHEELANMSATSRQTATRVLDQWEREGYVELAWRAVIVKDPAALGALAQL